jgi:hypothetical protein
VPQSTECIVSMNLEFVTRKVPIASGRFEAYLSGRNFFEVSAENMLLLSLL